MSGKAKKEKEIEINSLFISQINKLSVQVATFRIVFTLYLFSLCLFYEQLKFLIALELLSRRTETPPKIDC